MTPLERLGIRHPDHPGADGRRVHAGDGRRRVGRRRARLDRGGRERCGRRAGDDRGTCAAAHRPAVQRQPVRPRPAPQPIRRARRRGSTALAPPFAGFGAEPPAALRTIYRSFADDRRDAGDAARDAGRRWSASISALPPAARIAALKAAGCVAARDAPPASTRPRRSRRAGIDAVVAQGYEAGGHRGIFDPAAPDDALGTLALTRLLAARAGAAGDRRGRDHGWRRHRRRARASARSAAQLGTAFIACPESGGRRGLPRRARRAGRRRTPADRAISGRPARCLANRFTALGAAACAPAAPDYPIAYDAGKALNAAAKAKGEHGFGAQWAGQGAPFARPMPAAALVATLWREARPGA